jgi:membrane associated rhomboid family serine protease
MLMETPARPARPPAINLPPATKYLMLVLALIHIARLFLPPGLDTALVATFGFSAARYSDPDGFGWAALVAPVTYMFLHGGWLHLAVNLASLAAFGSAVERPLTGETRPRTMLAIFFLSGLAAALSQYAVAPHSPDILIGASGGISGLFAYAFLAMQRAHALTFRRTAALILLMVGVLWVTGAVGMPGVDAPIAWLAHIGGFLAGAALYGFSRLGARGVR